VKKILFTFFIFTCLYSQTGIITSKGFQGGGLWVKVNRPFTESLDGFYDLKLEYYSNIGLEFFFGKHQVDNIEPWNFLGLSYHLKLKKIGVQFQYAKNRYDDYDFFDDGIYFEESSITFYKTGKLNPFFTISNINKHGYDYNQLNRQNYISIGGLGRVTRFMTFSCSLNLPIDDLIYINNGYIQASIGFIGLEEIYGKYLP